MSSALILEFHGVTTDQYEAVNEIIGLDPVTGAGQPAGMLGHSAAISDAGDLVVFEVWESPAAQAAFMESALGPALGKAALPAPSRVEWLSVLSSHSY